MNKHQVSPELMTKLRAVLVSEAHKSDVSRIERLSDDALINEATEELRRLYTFYFERE